jgi:hypothetical protein
VSEPEPAPRRRLGCALAVVAVLGALLAVGLLLGRRHHASLTPCERYAETVARRLDNCHSGANPDHLAICRASVDPSPACLERIEALTCDELERGAPASAGEVCRKHP